MDRTVRYGRIGEVVILIFPDEAGSKHFITHIETENLLKNLGVEKMPIPTFGQELKPRIVG